MSWLTADRIAEVRDYVAWWYRQWPKPLSAFGSDFDAAEIATTLDELSNWLEERQIDASPLRNFNRQPRSELVDSVLNLLERAERELQKAPEQKAPPIPPPAPAKILRGWPEICAALGIKSHDDERIRYYIERVDGCPIRLGPKGVKPDVVESDLLHWWHSVEKTIREQGDKRRDAQATVGETYNHGSAFVVPDIAGHIKRSKKVTKGN